VFEKRLAVLVKQMGNFSAEITEKQLTRAVSLTPALHK